ncbi:HPr family phosphocarrier protein [Olsenella uli]|uniref:HPr family phosphocarrier protein n=1 Tax=Olsenella uli TaxID=133926 RepID=UPI0012ABC785|nr:HPr family phosphocarrier protein [Olsenella uli]
MAEKSFQYMVTDAAGLHARPASDLSKFAKSLGSKVTLVKGDKRVDAKSVLMIMAAGVSQGNTVTFEVSGDDAEREAAELEEFCKQNL